jgi:predicted CXXCH cytochrome family protein
LHHRFPTFAARGGRRGWPLLISGAGALALVLLWTGCNVERDYAILSFFLDGVPDPNAEFVIDERGRRRRAGVTYITHAPYAEENCAACHRGSRSLMLTRVESTVCLKCHEGIVDEYPFMHGPVAASDCLWCHSPHESPNPHLLKAPGTELCLQCHGLTFSVAPAAPYHPDPEQSCLDCHHGHGGGDRFFIVELTPEEAPGSETDEPAEPGGS